jgi:hypothetical protein
MLNSGQRVYTAAIFQGVSCNKLSLFRISDKRKQQNMYIRLTFKVFSPTTGSLESDN